MYASLLLALSACAAYPDPPPPPAPRQPPDATTPAVPATVGAMALQAQPRNLVLLFLDTLRKDAIGRYDPDGRALTPFLDQLFDDGFTVDDHQACSSWCYPSVFCAYGGMSPAEAGWVPMPADEIMVMPDGFTFLASMLGDGGFTSAVVASNAVFSPMWDTTRGFDVVEYHQDAQADYVTELGLALLDDLQADGAPWVLNLQYFDTHGPYRVPEGYEHMVEGLAPIAYDLDGATALQDIARDWDGLSADEQALIQTHLSAHYAAEVRYLDDQLALLWAELEARGALDDAMVVVWTDHGDQFFEHGKLEHGAGLHAEENDAVLAFWSPALTPGSHSGPTTGVDMTPTVLALMGVAEPPGLTGHVVGLEPQDRVRTAFSSEIKGLPVQAVQDGDLRLHYTWQGEVSVYNRATDPAEETDLLASEPEAAAALWALLTPEVEAYQALLPQYTAVDPGL